LSPYFKADAVILNRVQNDQHDLHQSGDFVVFTTRRLRLSKNFFNLFKNTRWYLLWRISESNADALVSILTLASLNVRADDPYPTFSIFLLKIPVGISVENIGVEPMTSCVQGRRSSQLS
jgi:hypothetical protein